MHKLLLLTFLAGLILTSCNQPVQVDTLELKKIYSDILEPDSLKGKFYLIDSIESFDKKVIVQSDTIYSIAYCDEIKNGIWTNNLFDSLLTISADKMHSISKSDSFKITPIHYSFSLPYFSKDKNSFIVYYNYYCGSLCAEYSLRLYKKINGKWTFIKSSFSIVS
jgi:hypothetical protein